MFEALASVFNGIFNRSAAQDLNNQNIANQDYLARNRIQMTVADANKGGINPLAALGNATQSYSNVVGNTGLGDSMRGAGQSIDRAIAAQAPLDMRNKELQNKLIEAKIAAINSDTIKNTAVASETHKALGVPGIPMPQPDPRGPVIQLLQRGLDWRSGQIVDIPSKEAASPLQTLAATPTNAALAGRTLWQGLTDLDTDHGGGQESRSATSDQWNTGFNF